MSQRIVAFVSLEEEEGEGGVWEREVIPLSS